MLCLEAEVPGESAAALGLVDAAYAEPTQQVGGAAALEGGVLVAVGLEDDVLGQRRRAPVLVGEIGEGPGEGLDAARHALGGLGAEQFGDVTFQRGRTARLGHDDRPVVTVERGDRAGHDLAGDVQLSGADPGQPAAQSVPRRAGDTGVGQHTARGSRDLGAEGAGEAVDEEHGLRRLRGFGGAQGLAQGAAGGEGGNPPLGRHAAETGEQLADRPAQQRVDRPGGVTGQGGGPGQPAE
ncbi:hypothetical protein SAFG77S_04889 [Streptomyces afghaniensis]